MGTLSIRHIAAREFGQGMISAGATTAFWAALPTMEINQVERIVRELPVGERFGVIKSAIEQSDRSRVAELKARFTADELRAMVTAP